MDSQQSLPPEAYEASRSSARAVEVVRDRLRKAWEHDPDFFSKFFPVDSRIRRIYEGNGKGLRHRNRWKGIPSEPNTASQLYTPLNNLLNDILQILALFQDARRFLNTSRKRVCPNLEFPIWPPLLLVGAGRHFVCTPVNRPLAEYALGISALEIRLEQQDEGPLRDRLATVMQQMFLYQYNRRYAFGLVISQQTLTIHMFDRSGIVSSPSIDYHAHPNQFCAIIAGLASMDEARLGLDTTIMQDGLRGVVRTREVVGKAGV